MPRATSSQPDIVRGAEAAERLGVHPNTLARWAKRGWLNVVTLRSGELHFHAADVAALRERIYAE
jgi:predicted site-specific integrase-resolvase